MADVPIVLPDDPKGWPPVLVAFVRGVIEAAGLAIISALIVWLGNVTAGTLAPWAPFAILLLRAVEGFLDNWIDPTRQRALGGQPAPETAEGHYRALRKG